MGTQEIWKDWDGPAKQISNYGNTRRWDKKKKMYVEWKQQTDSEGYKNIHYKGTTLRVQRMVAEKFIGHIPDGFVVNHKDENKSNNHVSNLEICTVKYNNNYGTRTERAAKKISSVMKKWWDGNDEARENMRNLRLGSHHTEESREKISKKLKGRQFTKEHCEKIAESSKNRKDCSKQVLELDYYSGEVINIFPSAAEVARVYGFDKTSVKKCCAFKQNHVGGKIFTYDGGKSSDELRDEYNQRIVNINKPIRPSENAQKASVEKCSKPVAQINKTTGEIIAIFKSGSEASKATGVSQDTISRLCKGKIKKSRRTEYGWVFL